MNISPNLFSVKTPDIIQFLPHKGLMQADRREGSTRYPAIIRKNHVKK